MGRTSNIASPHKYYNVAWTERLEHRRAQLVKAWHEFNCLTLFTNRACKTLAIHTRDFPLTCRIYFRDPKLVRLLEARCKLPKQPLRARVAMRLKCHQQPPRGVPFDSGQRRFDLGGVMSVIFNHLET